MAKSTKTKDASKPAPKTTRKKKVVTAKDDIKEAKPKAIGPFDIINMIFKDKDTFNILPDTVLKKNSFMVNRVFAIMYPLQADCFNSDIMNPADTVKAWAYFAWSKMRYGMVPSFVYTKVKKEEPNAVGTTEYQKKDIQQYCAYFNISMNDFNDLKELFPDELDSHLSQYIQTTQLTDQKFVSKS